MRREFETDNEKIADIISYIISTIFVLSIILCIIANVN